MMWSATLYALVAAVPLVTAQTYPGFMVDIQAKLDVLYGDINVENGQQLPRAGKSCRSTLSYTTNYKQKCSIHPIFHLQAQHLLQAERS
jgi:hypothetical protein